MDELWLATNGRLADQIRRLAWVDSLPAADTPAVAVSLCIWLRCRAGRLEGKARTQEWWGLWRACPSVRMRLRRSVSVYVGVFVCL
jgi:hypothetical protein